MDFFYINYDDFDGRLDLLIDKLDFGEEYHWLLSGCYGYPHSSEFNYYNSTARLQSKSEILKHIADETYFWEGGLITLFKNSSDKENILEWGVPPASAFATRLGTKNPLLHPLAETEIFLDEQYGLVFKSNSKLLTKRFINAYPQAKTGDKYQEDLSKQTLKQKECKKKANILLTLILILTAFAGIYLADVVIFAQMLGWENSDGFIPWGIISIILLLLPIALLLPYFFYKLKEKTPSKRLKGDNVSNEQIKNELDFLIKNGFKYKPYQMPKMDKHSVINVHRFENEEFIIEAASIVMHQRRKKITIVEFKSGIIDKNGAIILKNLTQCSLATKEERDELAFALSRRCNVFEKGKCFLLKIIERMNENEIAVKLQQSEIKSNTATVKEDNAIEQEKTAPASMDLNSEDEGEISMPIEFYELEMCYNKRMRKYRILYTLFITLILTSFVGYISIVNYNLIGSIVSIVISSTAIVTALAVWNLSYIFIARYNKGLREIRFKQHKIFQSIMSKVLNSDLDVMQSHTTPQKSLEKKPQANRSIIPAIAFSTTAILLVAIGALLKTKHEGFFILSIVLSVTFIISAIIYILNIKHKKAIFMPQIIFILLILPYFLSFFIVSEKSLTTQAIGYSVATTFVCLAIIVPILIKFYILVIKKRAYLGNSALLFIVSAQTPHHYIYYKDYRASVIFGKNKILELNYQKFEVNESGELIFTTVLEENNTLKDIYAVIQKLTSL